MGAILKRCGPSDFRLKRCGADNYRLRNCIPGVCPFCGGSDPSEITAIASGFVLCSGCYGNPSWSCRWTPVGTINGTFVLSQPPGAFGCTVGCGWLGLTDATMRRQSYYGPTCVGSPFNDTTYALGIWLCISSGTVFRTQIVGCLGGNPTVVLSSGTANHADCQTFAPTYHGNTICELNTGIVNGTITTFIS